jgi:hypothetical protein
MVSLPRNKGGQFAPEYDGHFNPESTDHFASDLDGQYQRNLHLHLDKNISPTIFTNMQSNQICYLY